MAFYYSITDGLISEIYSSVENLKCFHEQAKNDEILQVPPCHPASSWHFVARVGIDPPQKLQEGTTWTTLVVWPLSEVFCCCCQAALCYFLQYNPGQEDFWII